VELWAGSEYGQETHERLTRALREQGPTGYWEETSRIFEEVRGPSVPLAVAYLHTGDREGALEWLERAVEGGTAGSPPDIFFDPGLDPLRGDPRFERLFTRIGLSGSGGSRS
jgi:hypothetical protein